MKPPIGVVISMPAMLPIVSAVPIRPLSQPRCARNTPTNGPMPDCISAIKKLTASKGQSVNVRLLLCRMRTRASRDLSREAGIKIDRDFPSPLWPHFRGAPFARRPARAERLPMLIVLGLPRSAVIERWSQFSVFFVDLPAMLELQACRRILSFGHG